MISKGIRGAIIVEYNFESSIRDAVLELLNAMMVQNNINKEMISHVIFTVTNDINAAFPAKFARKDLGWDDVAMLCFNELDVPDALRMCLRVLIVVNCTQDFEPKFVYLKGAEKLRN